MRNGYEDVFNAGWFMRLLFFRPDISVKSYASQKDINLSTRTHINQRKYNVVNLEFLLSKVGEHFILVSLLPCVHVGSN